MPEINLVASLKNAYEIVHSLLKERDARIVNEKAIELTTIIMSAQQSALAANQAQFTLAERVRELEAELVKLKAWRAEKENYKLAEWKHGVMAYIPKEIVQGPEAPHALCANCFDNGKRSILQAVRVLHTRKITCAGCRSEITTTSP